MTGLSVRNYLLVLLAIAAIGPSGCSSVRPPTGTISQAQLAIRQAEQNQASQYAPLELRNAQDKLDRAENAMRNEDYLTARRLSEQALADAQVADVKAESEVARQNVVELRRVISSLRAELERESR